MIATTLHEVRVQPGRRARIWTGSHPDGLEYKPAGWVLGQELASSVQLTSPRMAGVELFVQTGAATHYACFGGTFVPRVCRGFRVDVGWSKEGLAAPSWLDKYGGSKFTGMPYSTAVVVAEAPLEQSAAPSGTLLIDHAATARSSASPFVLRSALLVVTGLILDPRVAEDADAATRLIRDAVTRASKAIATPVSRRGANPERPLDDSGRAEDA